MLFLAKFIFTPYVRKTTFSSASNGVYAKRRYMVMREYLPNKRAEVHDSNA